MNISTGIIIFIAFIPALCWFILYYQQNKKDPEPLGVLWRTFVWGGIGTTLLMGIQYICIQRTGIAIIEWLRIENVPEVGITFIFALLEESIKGWVLFSLILKYRKTTNQFVDGIMLGVSVALGFSFIENIFYFIQIIHLVSRFDFVITYLFRTLGTMFAHTLFSGIVGYFIAYGILDAHTHKLIIKKEKGVYFSLKDFIIEIITFHTLFHHILTKYPSTKGHFLFGIFFESLFLSTVLHFVFNLLLSTNLYDKNLMFLSVPFLFLIAGILFKKFKDKQALKIRQVP